MLPQPLLGCSVGTQQAGHTGVCNVGTLGCLHTTQQLTPLLGGGRAGVEGMGHAELGEAGLKALPPLPGVIPVLQRVPR